jgi:hypothetical protein
MRGMPPRARARSRKPSGPAALSDEDVALLRERLESGKKPRVMLLVDTALESAGTSVPIVGFADPAVGEFISIKLRDDVVPFSPAELSLPVRGAKPKPAPAPASLPLEPQPAARPSHPSEGYRPSGAIAAESSGAAERRPARLMAVPEPAESDVQPPAPAAAPAKAAKKRPTRTGAMSVTLRFNGQAWTYESTRGGKRSAGRPLNLAAVRALADRLDDPPLRREMQNAIDACRQQVQSRADQLRLELERVEIELAELDE